jgi:hypothetical protein
MQVSSSPINEGCQRMSRRLPQQVIWLLHQASVPVFSIHCPSCSNVISETQLPLRRWEPSAAHVLQRSQAAANGIRLL